VNNNTNNHTIKHNNNNGPMTINISTSNATDNTHDIIATYNNSTNAINTIDNINNINNNNNNRYDNAAITITSTATPMIST